MESETLWEKIVQYGFYFLLVVALVCSVFICYSMLWVAWQIIKALFNWLIAR